MSASISASVIASHPNIVVGGQVATGLASVDNATRFNKHDVAFGFGVWLVHHALWDDVHLTFSKVNGLVLHFDLHRALDNDEHLVGVLMIVPDKLTLEFSQLELKVVHICDDAWAPVFVEQGQFLCQVDGGHEPLRPPVLLWFISGFCG
jgi:hypothetical protein